LDLRFDLELGILDLLDDLFRERLLDSLLERDLLARAGKVDLGIGDLRARDVDVPSGEALLEDIEHLLELEFGLRLERDDAFLGALEFGIAALEVEAVGE